MMFKDAIAAALHEQDVPVVTAYELFVLAARIVREKHFQKAPVERLPPIWDQQACKRLIRQLEKNKTVTADRDFGSRTWRVLRAQSAGTAEQACCLVDPFCYVSHLSAMQHYGLTDRSPVQLYLSTPARAVWNEMRDVKIAKDLGSDVRNHPIAPLARILIKPKVRRRAVELHETAHPAIPIEIREIGGRIASIGRTFIDMLDQPALCGGIHHAIQIWEGEARSWLEEIFGAATEQTSKITKMRAGYILEERLQIKDRRLEAWKALAQRGSSRKLDPDAPYAPTWSENWMISINV